MRRFVILALSMMIATLASWATRFQAETTPLVKVADVGGGTITVMNYSLDDGSHVLLPDSGDVLRITFTVSRTGFYRLSLRQRAGEGSANPTKYWTNGYYAYQLDGCDLALGGDGTTLSSGDSGDGGWTIWGTARSELVYLLSGSHDLDIRAKYTNCKADYLDVDEVIYQAETSYTRLTDPDADVRTMDYALDDGSHVLLPDNGDAIRLTFSVPRTAWYHLRLRVRAGNGTYNQFYWANNYYGFTLDGGAVTFTGDPNTLAGLDQDAWTYWGTMVSGLCYLTGGNHTLDITARYTDCKVDYLQVQDSTRIVDCNNVTYFNGGVRGQNPYRGLDNSAPNYYRSTILGICNYASIRSLPAGGLDADTYDWRRVDSGWIVWGSRPTTLDVLRELRDYHATGIWTANMWGGGHPVIAPDPNKPLEAPACGVAGCPSQTTPNHVGWHCMLPSGGITATAQMAADWVRYCNILVQNYRLNGSQIVNLSGTPVTLTGDNLRVYNSITWSPKLLTYGEAATPKAIYWEIGNEPGPTANDDMPGFLYNHGFTETEFSSRYASIVAAMTTVDSTIKVGPCVTYPDVGDSPYYLDRLRTDGRVMNFVSYHPYYDQLEANWGNVLGMESGLRGINKHLRIRKECADDYAPECIASEYNASGWDTVPHEAHEHAMLDALGQAESVFSFAQQGLTAANFWAESSTYPLQMKMWNGLQAHMGYQFLNTYSDGGNTRMYVTKKPEGDLVIWGLNFSDTYDRTLVLSFGNLPTASSFTVTKYELKNPSGDTSLMTMDTVADWVTTSGGTLTPAQLAGGYMVNFEDATLTIITLHPNP